MLLFSIILLSAKNINNQGTRTIMETIRTNVEGTINDVEVNTDERVKVDGEQCDLPSRQAYKESTAPVRIEHLPNIDDPTSGRTYSSPVEKQGEKESLRDSKPPRNRLDERWGDDVQIHAGDIGSGIDFDEDEDTDDIYAIVDTWHTINDSMIVYRSTDGGDTWNFWRASINDDGSVTNPKIRVARDAGGQTWVCMFGIWHEPSGDQMLYMRRMTPDQSQAYWELVSDTVEYVDADADVGSGAWVYVTYIPMNSANDIWVARNYLDGDGWKDFQSIFDNPMTYPYPQIAAGADGNVAVTFVDNRFLGHNEVRIKRSVNYGSTWLSSEQVSNNSGLYALSYTDIAYNHESTQIGWIFASFLVGAANNLVYYYSTNSGVDWTYYGVISPAGEDETKSTVRALKTTSSGAVTVAYKEDNGDSVLFIWASGATPTDFTTPVRINDNLATGSIPPVAGWIYHGGIYSAIVYAGWGPTDAYFDWFGNTGTEEKPGKEVSTGFVRLAPNPSNRTVELSYAVQNEGNVRISIYDATGRFVNNLVDETKPAGEYMYTLRNQNLMAGIYFVRVETSEHVVTKPMTILR